MCTYCGQHCVEDETYRGNDNIPENICPDKFERVTRPFDDHGTSYTIDDIYAQGWNNNQKGYHTIDTLIEELDKCEKAKSIKPPLERANPYEPFIDDDLPF